MTETTERFDAAGVVRRFERGSATAATFYLDVDGVMVPCQINTAGGTPPKDGQRVRALGAWVLDRNQLLSVDVHAMLPAGAAT